MDIGFRIPEWVLWLIGLPLGLIILFLAAFGGRFIYDLYNDGPFFY